MRSAAAAARDKRAAGESAAVEHVADFEDLAAQEEDWLELGEGEQRPAKQARKRTKASPPNTQMAKRTRAGSVASEDGRPATTAARLRSCSELEWRAEWDEGWSRMPRRAPRSHRDVARVKF